MALWEVLCGEPYNKIRYASNSNSFSSFPIPLQPNSKPYNQYFEIGIQDLVAEFRLNQNPIENQPINIACLD